MGVPIPGSSGIPRRYQPVSTKVRLTTRLLVGGGGGLLVLLGRGGEATLGTCLAVSCWRDIALVTRTVGSNTLGSSASLLLLSTLGNVALALADALLSVFSFAVVNLLR